jgi:hypothetical protein
MDEHPPYLAALSFMIPQERIEIDRISLHLPINRLYQRGDAIEEI